MFPSETFWHQFVAHWREWGINGIVGGAAATIAWILARRKEWKQSKHAKAEQKLDSAILKALDNRTLWKGSRPMTGAGNFGVKSSEMAEHLKLDQDVVTDGLERLEVCGRVMRSDGGMSDPAPWWYIVPR